MNAITSEEAEELLLKFVTVRDKCTVKDSKGVRRRKPVTKATKSTHKEYDEYTRICIDKFDYIVKNTVKKYRSFSNYNDLFQDGRVALMLALSSYQSGKGSWFWWANHYVKTKVSREANRHSTIKIPIKLTKTMTPYKVSKIPSIIDENPSALDSIENTETTDMVRCSISKLPTIHRRVIEMRYDLGPRSASGYTVAQICSELKISNKECSKILNDAKSLLKDDMQEFI